MPAISSTPLIVEGQIHGGLAQAMIEEVAYGADRDGGVGLHGQERHADLRGGRDVRDADLPTGPSTVSDSECDSGRPARPCAFRPYPDLLVIPPSSSTVDADAGARPYALGPRRGWTPAGPVARMDSDPCALAGTDRSGTGRPPFAPETVLKLRF